MPDWETKEDFRRTKDSARGGVPEYLARIPVVHVARPAVHEQPEDKLE